MGVYPLLADETCWFLAADFDKKSWQEDIAAFVETCGGHGVPVAIERSRSGNGAHAWFFFAAPVPAVGGAQARLLPDHRDDGSPPPALDGVVRPAVPQPGHHAQGRVRQPDRAAAPARAARMRATRCSSMPPSSRGPTSGRSSPGSSGSTPAARSRPRRRGHPARSGDRRAHGRVAVDEDDRTPWKRPPSGRPRRPVITEPLPRAVKAVLGQRLFIEKAGLPSPLLNQLKRLAAFQNPEFYKKQSMRLSTALTPRVIACAEDSREHIALPRGCLRRPRRCSASMGSTLEVEDEREAGAAVDFTFRGTLTPLQEQARPRCSPTTSACSSRRRASGRRWSAPTSSPPAAQHARPRPPQAAPRPVGRPARAVPRHRAQGHRPDRRRQVKAERPARRGHGAEPGPQGLGRRSRRRLRPGHPRRGAPRARR